MPEVQMRTYHFKQYRRTKPGGTTGELVKSLEIEAEGLAQAHQIVNRDNLLDFNFDSDFAILEGDTGFATCWLTKPPHT
jgi:hypothetical protein